MDARSPNLSGFALLLGLAAATTVVAGLPLRLAFPAFAFGDPGLELVAQSRHLAGGQPGVDLGWIYGLLPLVIGAGWYGVWGVSPASFAAAAVVCELLLLAGVVEFVREARLAWPGRMLLIATCPLWLPNGGFTLVHEIEPVLIVWAVVFHLRGRLSWCLVLLTVCLFVKPSLAGVFGLIVCVQAIAQRSGIRVFVPAAVAGVIVGGSLTLWYGPAALLDSLYPSAARRVYLDNNFGFFATGRQFWAPDGASFRFYATHSVAGLWLGLSGFVAAAAAVCYLRPGDGAARRTLVVLLLLHTVFVLLLFGNPWSYRYYFYLLVMAGALATTATGWVRYMAILFSAWAAVLVARDGLVAVNHWTMRGPSATTYGLWATASYRSEWEEMLSATPTGEMALLAASEGVTHLTDHFGPPVLTFADSGAMTTSLVKQKRAQLAAAEYLIIPVEFTTIAHDPARSPYAAELSGFAIRTSGKHFRVFRKIRH